MCLGSRDEGEPEPAWVRVRGKVSKADSGECHHCEVKGVQVGPVLGLGFGFGFGLGLGLGLELELGLGLWLRSGEKSPNPIVVTVTTVK